jgi:hypothetical protein
MRDWSLLKQRLPELKLRASLRAVAELLIDGRTTSEIAIATGNTAQQVKLKVAVISYFLWRLPPDSSASAVVPVVRGPAPLGPGHATHPPSQQP